LRARVALAADVLPPAAPALGAYNWQGPYAGLNLGYQWAWLSHSPARPSGVAGGIQGGYNWQRGALVFGAEADLQLSAADDRFAAWKFSNPWFGTVRGRAGVAFDRLLLYGTIGLAYGTLHAQSLISSVSEFKTNVGLAAGGGLEVALFGNLSARYLYVDLGDIHSTVGGFNRSIASSYLRLGVNYRF
jgi:outer membrane immunogenic protein